MSQASEYLRDKFADDGVAVQFLQKQGYVLGYDWCWTMPRDHDMTQDEADAIDYLCDEWDFGGVN